MRRRWLALLLCEACLFPSLGDLSSGDAGGADASDASDATTVDVASDVGADVSDAGARFCALHTAAVFCDDFDDASTLSPSWTTLNMMGDASFAIVQDNPISSPNIARSTVGATTSSGEANVGRKVDVASGQTLSFGAAVRADAWPVAPYASLASIYTDSSNAASLVLGYNNKAPLLVVDQPGDAGSATYAVALPSGWFRLTFVLAVTGSTSTIDLLVDGQTAIGGPKPGPPIFSQQVAVYIGVYATNVSAPIAWSFDDAYAEIK